MNVTALVLFAQLAVSTAPAVIRVNQLGYLPDAPKVAVYCDRELTEVLSFTVTDAAGDTVLDRRPMPGGPFGPCAATLRLDFSSIKQPGEYRIHAGPITSPLVRIRPDAYVGAADTLLYYMREQRSGYNPLFKQVVHTRDGIVVDDSTRAGNRQDGEARLEHPPSRSIESAPTHTNLRRLTIVGREKNPVSRLVSPA